MPGTLAFRTAFSSGTVRRQSETIQSQLPVQKERDTAAIRQVTYPTLLSNSQDLPWPEERSRAKQRGHVVPLLAASFTFMSLCVIPLS